MINTANDHLEIALDEAERELYRAARACTDAMRSAGISSEELDARRALLDAARSFAKIEIVLRRR
jgi:hypothetical protein